MELDPQTVKALRAGRGFVPDPPDPRDYVLAAAAPVAEKTVTYEQQLTPVRDQLQRPTCVGFSSAAVKEYFDNKERGTNVVFSPNHLYWLCKQNDNDPNGEGTTPRVAMQMLVSTGIALESDWPYTDPVTPIPNPATIAVDAAPQRIKTYARLINTRDMVASIILNGPFVAGIVVTDGFYTPQAVHSGIIDDTIPVKDTDGGHAVAIVGYDAQRQWFRAKNSWGTDYGDRGYIWLSKAYMEANALDAWAMVDDTAIDAGLIIKNKPVHHAWHFPPFRDYISN